MLRFAVDCESSWAFTFVTTEVEGRLLTPCEHYYPFRTLQNHVEQWSTRLWKGLLCCYGSLRSWSCLKQLVVGTSLVFRLLDLLCFFMLTHKHSLKLE